MHVPGANPLRLALALLLLGASACRPPELAAATSPTQGSGPVAQGSEPVATPGLITIHNGTEKVITYTILSPGGEQLNRSIVPGVVDELPDSTALTVAFMHHDARHTRELYPGRHYTFRTSSRGELGLEQRDHGEPDVRHLGPYEPTPMPVVDKMLELAEVDASDVVYDIGCGDGRIVIRAAKKYGARGVGIDVDPERIAESNANARQAGVADRVEFRLEDAAKSDFSDATVVTLYLLPITNVIIRPLLEQQLKPGARVATHRLHLSGWQDRPIGAQTVKDEQGAEHTIVLYRR